MVEPKKASVTVLGGPLSGTRFLLPESGTVTIGSAEEASFSLALGPVAPYHVHLDIGAGRVTVFPEGGQVFVNDDAVLADGTVLRNGDVVWLGTPGADEAVMLQCVLPRRVPDAAAEAVPAEPAPPQAAPEPARPSPVDLVEITQIDETEAEGAATDAEAVIAEAEPVEAEPEAFVAEPEAFVAEPEEAAEVDAVIAEPEAVAAEPVGPEEEAAETFVVDASPARAEEAYSGFIDDTEAETFVVEPAGTAAVSAVTPPLPPTVVLPPPTVALLPPAPAAPPVAAPHAPTPAAPAAPPLPHQTGRVAAVAPPVARPAAAAHASGAHAAVRPAAVHAPVAHAARPARAARSGGIGRTLAWTAAGVAGLAALGVAAYFGWKQLAPSSAPHPQVTPAALARTTPAPPVPAAATPEPSTATPEPTAEPAATPSAAPTTAAAPTVAPTPTPRPTPTPQGKPTPTPTPAPAAAKPPAAAPPVAAAAAPEAPRGPDTATQVQTLVGQAETALAARQYDAAIGHADAALRLDGGNARASALKADAARRRDLARRRFVAGATAVQSQKAQGGGLAGFESGDADLRRAPDFQGRIEFEMTPATGLEPGAAWTLRAFVVNEGKKPIRVQGVTIATNANGTAAGGTVPPKARDIAPQQRALVGETTGSWAEGTSAWSAEVTVTANKGDSLRNSLSWR